VVTPGLDNIYRSASAGQTWTTYAIQGTGGGTMLSSLQFMSPATGCLVTGTPGTGSGSLTGDQGPPSAHAFDPVLRHRAARG
jgi:hypothetical protein